MEIFCSPTYLEVLLAPDAGETLVLDDEDAVGFLRSLGGTEYGVSGQVLSVTLLGGRSVSVSLCNGLQCAAVHSIG